MCGTHLAAGRREGGVVKLDERLIKSFVWHDGKCFFVSTIDRDSSSLIGGRFSETIVWAYDWEANERGASLYEECGIEGSIKAHLDTVRRIHDTGSPDKEQT